jgi:hypothetical protein
MSFRFVLLIALCFSMVGCAWQRIPASPEYAKDSPIPLRVGLAATPGVTPLAGEMADEFKSMRLFDHLIYPYRDGDSVDAVLRLTVNGTIEGSGFARGLLIGLSFFTLSPFVGPVLNLEHDAIAAVEVPGKGEVRVYKAHASTETSFGLAANTAQVGLKTRELQKQRLADALSRKIREDRGGLLEAIKKP